MFGCSAKTYLFLLGFGAGLEFRIDGFKVGFGWNIFSGLESGNSDTKLFDFWRFGVPGNTFGGKIVGSRSWSGILDVLNWVFHEIGIDSSGGWVIFAVFGSIDLEGRNLYWASFCHILDLVRQGLIDSWWLNCQIDAIFELSWKGIDRIEIIMTFILSLFMFRRYFSVEIFYIRWAFFFVSIAAVEDLYILEFIILFLFLLLLVGDKTFSRGCWGLGPVLFC